MNVQPQAIASTSADHELQSAGRASATFSCASPDGCADVTPKQKCECELPAGCLQLIRNGGNTIVECRSCMWARRAMTDGLSKRSSRSRWCELHADEQMMSCRRTTLGWNRRNVSTCVALGRTDEGQTRRCTEPHPKLCIFPSSSLCISIHLMSFGRDFSDLNFRAMKLHTSAQNKKQQREAEDEDESQESDDVLTQRKQKRLPAARGKSSRLVFGVARTHRISSARDLRG